MPDQWMKITSIVQVDVGELFEAAAERVLVVAPRDASDAVQNGIVLEAILADFLASPYYPPREKP